MIDFTKLTAAQLQDFKNKYDTYIFDFDETLIQLNGSPIEGVEEALNEIAKSGKSILVFTDNCVAQYKDVTEKVNRIFPMIKKENVITSGHLVVKYLQEINFKKKLYVLGTEDGLIQELKDYGFDVIYDDGLKKMTIPDLKNVKLEEGVGAVVVASDPNFNYLKLFKASNYLSDPRVLLIQTHIPNVVEKILLIPGVGCMVASIKAASGRKESTATGKGGDYGTKYVKSLALDIEKCLFVGDGIFNDVPAGHALGMDTMLVLSGEATLEAVEAAKSQNRENQIPKYYANSVADLLKVFRSEE